MTSEIPPLPSEVPSNLVKHDKHPSVEKPATSSPMDADPNGIASPSSVADTIQADELDESLEKIEISKKEIDEAVQGPHSPSHNSILLSNKKTLEIPCEPSKLPFTIKGGAENAELVYIDTVLHPDILDKLSSGDILLAVNKKYAFERPIQNMSHPFSDLTIGLQCELFLKSQDLSNREFSYCTFCGSPLCDHTTDVSSKSYPNRIREASNFNLYFSEVSGMVQKEVLFMLKSLCEVQSSLSVEYIQSGNFLRQKIHSTFRKDYRRYPEASAR